MGPTKEEIIKLLTTGSGTLSGISAAAKATLVPGDLYIDRRTDGQLKVYIIHHGARKLVTITTLT